MARKIHKFRLLTGKTLGHDYSPDVPKYPLNDAIYDFGARPQLFEYWQTAIVDVGGTSETVYVAYVDRALQKKRQTRWYVIPSRSVKCWGLDPPTEVFSGWMVVQKTGDRTNPFRKVAFSVSLEALKKHYVDRVLEIPK
ncbi:MAG: hypothetical protein SFU83_06925 [Meiothermus sp.]|nr:hypothetical protein [Meiothermus sp.]